MHALRGVAVFVVVGLSIAFTFFLTPESLWPMRQRTIEQRAIAAEVFRIVPKDGVILTERSDKLFFPARKVIHYDANEQPKIERLLVSLLERAPVYYFAEISKTSINYLNSNRLARYGVAWEDGVSIGDFTLYTLKRHSL